MRRADPHRFPLIQADAHACGELRPGGHTLFEGPNRRYHLTEFVGESVADSGLVRDFPTQRRHGLAEARFKVRILSCSAGRVVEVDDVDAIPVAATAVRASPSGAWAPCGRNSAEQR